MQNPQVAARPMLVCAARVYVGAHLTLDVIGGAPRSPEVTGGEPADLLLRAHRAPVLLRFDVLVETEEVVRVVPLLEFGKAQVLRGPV